MLNCFKTDHMHNVMKIRTIWVTNWNVIHDIITRDVSWVEIWEFSESQLDIIDGVIITKIIIFVKICNVDYNSAAKFKLPSFYKHPIWIFQERLAMFMHENRQQTAI